MNYEIILKRRLEIETWRVIGTVAKMQERDELMPFLKYLQEFPNGTAKDVSPHLFFDETTRVVVAKRFLSLLHDYGLVEEGRGYQLTDTGIKAATEERMFLPEDGRWEISVSNDSLLPHPVIKLEGFEGEPNAVLEVMGREAREKTEARSNNLGEIPYFLTRAKNIELIAHTGGKDIRIDEIKKKGEKVEPKFNFSIEWNVGEKIVRVFDEGKEITQFEAPEVSIEDIWENLLHNNGWIEDWDKTKEELSIKFEQVNDQSKITMKNNFKFESPNIQHNDTSYGKFEDVVVTDISICASTQDDAQQWAQWRLDNSINSFATEEQYNEWKEDALEPFAKFDVDLPTRNDAAGALVGKKYEQKDWYLLAASDWDL